MSNNRIIIIAAAMVALSAGNTQAGLLDSLFGGGGSGDARYWQGAWGTEGTTPVVTVSGSRVTYKGSNGEPFRVDGINIGSDRLTFRAGTAAISLARRSDTSVAMVSTMGTNSSQPIVLCKVAAPRC
jgi:hypothetical protein